MWNPLKKLISRIQNQKNNKTQPDITALGKEMEGGVLRRRISVWGRRRYKFRRRNHPWVR